MNFQVFCNEQNSNLFFEEIFFGGNRLESGLNRFQIVVDFKWEFSKLNYFVDLKLSRNRDFQLLSIAKYKLR